jgi:hypothetical protein
LGISLSKKIRIGGASGFWGDASLASAQLVSKGNVNYLVSDYLAEITMSIMARARAKNEKLGYATDFIQDLIAPNLSEIDRKGIKVISNAGGVNPLACAEIVESLISEAGLNLKVATILGDDLITRIEELSDQNYEEMYSREKFPEKDNILSVNAYLGAFPIASALNDGADIIITGRSVDSAVTLGACIYEFGWSPDDLDKLAGGSLAGHILECGTQATGGNFTDWQEAIDNLANIGYPITEISEDGTFICSKPEDTGGLITKGTIAEQMLYEIGDPQAYILPDVVCDFSDVEIDSVGKDQVLVKNAKGYKAPENYKVSLTYKEGFRGGAMLTYYGIEADKKAEMFSKAAFERARQGLRKNNIADFTETSVEIIGNESQYGEHRSIDGSREVVAKIAAKHEDAVGIKILLREITGLGLSTPPGLSGFAGTRPKPSPVVRLFSFAIPKDEVQLKIITDGKGKDFKHKSKKSLKSEEVTRPQEPKIPKADQKEMTLVPLIQLAWGRSGDKGNKANIGIIARSEEYYPYICKILTEDLIKDRFSHFLEGNVERFLLPGSNSINFLLHDVLGGGGITSLRNDPQGKGYAQIILDTLIPVPKDLI